MPMDHVRHAVATTPMHQKHYGPRLRLSYLQKLIRRAGARAGPLGTSASKAGGCWRSLAPALLPQLPGTPPSEET